MQHALTKTSAIVMIRTSARNVSVVVYLVELIKMLAKHHIGIQIGWRRKKINELERRKSMINVQIANLYDQIKHLEKEYENQKNQKQKAR